MWLLQVTCVGDDDCSVVQTAGVDLIPLQNGTHNDHVVPLGHLQMQYTGTVIQSYSGIVVQSYSDTVVVVYSHIVALPYNHTVIQW